MNFYLDGGVVHYQGQTAFGPTFKQQVDKQTNYFIDAF